MLIKIGKEGYIRIAGNNYLLKYFVVVLAIAGTIFASLGQVFVVQKAKAAEQSMYIQVNAIIQGTLAPAQAKIYCKTNSGEFVDSGRYASAGTGGYCQVSYNQNNTYQIQLRKSGYISATSESFSVDKSTYNSLPNGITSNSKNYQYPTTFEMRVDSTNPPPPTPPAPPAGATPVGHAATTSVSEPITDQMAPRNVGISVDTYAIKSAKVTITWQQPSAGPIANASNSVLSANFSRYVIARLDDAIAENYLNNALYTGSGGTINDINTTTFSQIVNSGRPDSKYCYYVKGIYGSTGSVSDRPCIDLTNNTDPKAFMQSSYSGSWPTGTTGNSEAGACGRMGYVVGPKMFNVLSCNLSDLLHRIARLIMTKATEYLQASIGVDIVKFEQPKLEKN